MHYNFHFQPPPPPKRGRSSEDFLMFCKMILDYENYEDRESAGEAAARLRHTSSPLGSTASTASVSSSGTESSSSFTEETRIQEPRHRGHRDISDTETDPVTGDQISASKVASGNK